MWGIGYPFPIQTPRSSLLGDERILTWRRQWRFVNRFQANPVKKPGDTCIFTHLKMKKPEIRDTK